MQQVCGSKAKRVGPRSQAEIQGPGQELAGALG